MSLCSMPEFRGCIVLGAVFKEEQDNLAGFNQKIETTIEGEALDYYKTNLDQC